MKSVIPFTKELEFSTKVSEITSISLEREFALSNGNVDGYLYVTGEYKSHEVSVNVIPFSFKIPFTIAVGEEVKEESVSLEISDFAYDMLKDSKIKVHIELELNFEEKEKEEEVEPNLPDESDNIIAMLEERHEKELEEENEEIEIEEEKIEEDSEEDDLKEETKQEEKSIEEPKDDLICNEENDMIEEFLPSTLEEDFETLKRTTSSTNENIEREEPIMINTVTEKEKSLITSKAESEYLTYYIHIVKEGDTLETICSMYHVTGGFLAEYNDVNNFTTGDKILIPFENE